jgi:hypothetical protein
MNSIIFFLLLLIFYYNIKKKFPLVVLNRNFNFKKDKLKVLTYNVQRLPYFIFRPIIDITKLLHKYDVICLQENFNQILSNYQSFDVNCIVPKCPFHKIVNSGLTIYSKVPINYIGFEGFNNLIDLSGICQNILWPKHSH